MHPPAIHSNIHPPSTPPPSLLPFHLETLSKTLQHFPKGKAPGYLSDSPDLLIDINERSVPLNPNETGSTFLQHLISLFLNGSIPETGWQILHDNYLLALYKDIEHRPDKLRPLGIGTSLRRLIDLPHHQGLCRTLWIALRSIPIWNWNKRRC
jgi:hypothetical protein